METDSSRAHDAAPLLFRHAAPRTSSDDLPGRYDAEAQLWVVETAQGCIPLITAAATAQLETSTSTRVRQEGDDDDASNEVYLCSTLLDTSTFTKVRQESADDDLSAEESLGAIDPAHMVGAILELETRTLNNQEGIDEDWPRENLGFQPHTTAGRYKGHA